MKDNSVKSSLAISFAALCLLIGMVGFGKYSFKNLRLNNGDLIEVKGLSERIVDSDIAEITIKIEGSDKNIEDVYKKAKSDKEKVMACLNETAFAGDIYKTNSAINNRERGTYDNQGRYISEKYFESTDEIFLKTKKFDQIENLKSKLSELYSQKIVVSCDCVYKLTNFQSLKLSMLDEAARNAWESANAFVKHSNGYVSDLVYLRQGEITINSDTASGGGSISSWDAEREEKASFKKRLRLVVRAGFKHS